MDKARWAELMNNLELGLTEDELKEGWHFCAWGWDGLLIHPLDEEFEHCSCFDREYKETLRAAASRSRY